MFRSLIVRPVNFPMMLILGMRTPYQIAHIAISWIAVWEMASLHPIGTRTDEGEQNEAVNKKFLMDARVPKVRT